MIPYNNWYGVRKTLNQASISDLLRRVHHDPHDSDARTDLADWVYKHDKDDSHSEDQYRLVVAFGRNMISRDPDDTWGYVIAGQALYEISKPPSSIPSFPS